MNLLKETIEVLKENGKTLKDIKWVGSRDYLIELEKLKGIFNIEYDEGFGAPEIAEDLFVVGEDWWLERHEYDGSEWWEFKSVPKKPTKIIKNAKVGLGMWSSLVQINEIED